MRVLGLDYGTVRIGVAISDFSGTIAHPKNFIPAVPLPQCLATIADFCIANEVFLIVVGLPKHMNGDEGVSATAARKLGTAIADKTALPVEYLDERLTTVSADKILTECEVGREKRKEKVDSIAAAIILQNYLDMRAFSETPMGDQ